MKTKTEVANQNVEKKKKRNVLSLLLFTTIFPGGGVLVY